jgi:hypothetical protein
VQKPYGKLVREEFERRLNLVVPFAHRVLKPGSHYWPDERVYRIDDDNSGRSFVIIYSPNANGSNSFSVEIGWAPLGALPELDHRPSRESPEEALANGLQQAVFRLGSFSEPRWDFLKITTLLETEPKLTEDRMETITSLLNFALSDLESNGLAFLRKAGLGARPC